jgi:hypothetical protein
MSLQFKRPQAKQTTSQCNILIRGSLSTVSYYPGLLTPSGGDRAQHHTDIQVVGKGGEGGIQNAKVFFHRKMKIKGTVSTDYWCI